MPTDVTRRSAGRRTPRWAPTLTFGSFVVTTVFYIAFMPVDIAAPQMGEALWFAGQDQSTGAQSATDMVASQTGAAVARASLPAQRAAQSSAH